MKTIKFVALSLVLLNTTSAFAQDTKATEISTSKPINIEMQLKGFDEYANKILKDWNCPGMGVGIVYKGKLVYSKGFGYRDVEKKLPVDANTLFAIASCTKAFTAVLIGQLVNEGKLDLDKSISSFYPQLKFYNDSMNNMITLRDMLSHRTGLPRHDVSWYILTSPSRDSMVKRIQYMESSATVREKWQYNNFMYMALGAIDEQISGKSWDENIKQKIFAPLNMTRSSTNLKDWKSDSNFSIGYGFRKDSTLRTFKEFEISAMAPAAAINSSVNEMANWVIAWINNGKFNGKELIPASFRNEAISSQSIVKKALPTAEKPDVFFDNYGFAWHLNSYKGHYLVQHGGNIDGYSSNTSFYPTDSIGIIVLSNQENSPVPIMVRNYISDKIFGSQYFDWSKDFKKLVAKAKAAKNAQTKKETVPFIEKPTTHDLKDYVGNYYNPGYGTIKIYLENNALYFTGAGKKMWFKHKTYDAFDLLEVDNSGEELPSDDPAIYGKFTLNMIGEIDGFSGIFEQGVKPIEFKKVSK